MDEKAEFAYGLLYGIKIGRPHNQINVRFHKPTVDL
jgi:hypothetical protein